MPPAKRRRTRSSRARRRTSARAAPPPKGLERAASASALASEPGPEPSPSPRAAGARPREPRPQAPWHPLPLSELLIVAGGAAVLFALANGPQRSIAALLAGLAGVVIGTTEVTLREHLSGYRSHALLLAALAVVVLHTVLVLVVSSFVSFPRTANVPLIAFDVALGFVFFRLLRARYVEARRRLALARR